MNRIYYPVWGNIKRIWVAISDMAASGWFSRPLVAMAIIFACMATGAGSAHAVEPGELPTGGNVTDGQANISQTSSTMTIDQQTDKMTAEWDTFNIGQEASVEFRQPGTSSVALNRIHDQNPSQIFGRLSSNGQVFLLNPSGIYFGPTTQVDVGGLVASTLNISDENFLEGKYIFESSGNNGAIVNDGNISALKGGYVAFIAPEIKNSALISADKGSALFAAGDRVNLDFTGDGLVTFTVAQGAIDAQIENKGLIKSNNGMVMMTAKAADDLTGSVINNTGIIEAKGVTEKGGRIFLYADGGQATISGTLDASSDTGKGGIISVTGERALVESGAHLTASGATGGGDVLVGGSWQGNDPALHQATGTVIEKGALLEANATDKGDGGTVVAWSDVLNPNSITRAYGTFEAKGGVNGGNGGRIETSGHWLDVVGSQGGASAAHGLAGVWLFDPYNVNITGADANGSWTGANPDIFSPTNTGSTINAATIAGKLEGGTSVTVTTNGGGGEIGNITVSSAITKASGNSDVTLTFNAANSIIINENISNTGGNGKLHLTLDADNDNDVGDGSGIIFLNANLATNGGNLRFGTGRTWSSTTVGGDVYVAGAGALTITTTGGNVDVNGEMILANTNGLTIDTTTGSGSDGNLRFYSLLNSGNQYSYVDGPDGQANSWDWARTDAKDGTNGLSAVNDKYLVTITSRLENSVSAAATGFDKGAWIGAYRNDSNAYDWVWSDGPEKDVNFFTQNAGGSGSPATGYYSNFGSGEPNGALNADSTAVETRGQFFGTGGQWNDLVETTVFSATQTGQYEVLGYIRETNLAASPLTIDVGDGTATFSGAVGGMKTLASLNVTSTSISGIAINGGAVTTEGIQTYTGDVTLGAAATTLTQTTVDTDFTVQAGHSITNAYTGDASLTIKTTGNIIMDANTSITSSSHALDTVLWSDSENTGTGYIFIHDGNTISTNGGDIFMAGGADINSDGRPDSYATSDTIGISGVNIGRNSTAANTGTTIRSDGGDIYIQGRSTAENGYGMGINFSHSGTLDAGAGNLTMLGESSSYAGVELSAWLDSAGADYLDINAYQVHIAAGSSKVNANGLASSQLNGEYTRITAGAGGISLYGNNSDDPTRGIKISLDASTTDGGYIWLESPNIVNFYNGSNAHNINAGTGDIVITANTFNVGTNNTLSGSGALTIQPRTAGRAINIGTTGAGALDIESSYFSTNFTNGFSGITVGNNTAGAITVGGATTFLDNTTLWSNANITVNGAVTANENLTLTGNGNISQTASLNIAGNTAITAGSANSIALSNAGNNFNGVVSVTSGNNVSIIDSNTMTLSSISADGLIDIATLTGDLTLTGAVATTNATANAITLNAGKNTAAGTSTGGNIIVSGGSISVGAGGTVKLYSGNITNSTGLTVLVGSESGRFRYNADETTDFSSGGWTVLGTGLNAIYREQPLLSVTPDSTSMNYGGSTPAISYALSGQVNGDTSLGVSGTATYNIGGPTSTSGNYTAGSHNVNYSSGLASGLGYGFANNNASTDELTVNQRAITISGITAANKVYDANTTATVDTTGAAGYISGDAVTVSALGLFDNKNVGTGKTVNLTSSYGGADLLNYTITDQATTTADITTKAITISGITASDKVYDATANATVDTTNATGWIAGDVFSVSVSGLFDNKNVGTDKTVTLTSEYSGTDMANYTITDQTATTADITPALLTITANNDTKTFDNLPYAGGNGVAYDGFAGNETPAVLSGVLEYGGSSQGAVIVGEYDIEPYGLESDNYEIVFYSGILNIRESLNDNIQASLTSRQNGTNGTGQNLKNGPSGPQFDMGPGTGSNTITGFGNLQLVTYSITDIRSATLESESGSSGIIFGPAPGDGTVMVIGGSPSGEMDIVIESIPVFEQPGEGEPVWQNNYTLREGDQVYSVTPDQGASMQPPPDITVPERQIPYTLRLEDGTSIHFYTGITPDGYLFINVPPYTGTIDQERLILMAIAVLKNKLEEEDSEDIQGVIIRRNLQGI